MFFFYRQFLSLPVLRISFSDLSTATIMEFVFFFLLLQPNPSKQPKKS